MPPEIHVALPSELAARLGALLAHQGAQALAARGRFSLALSGGSLASAFFPSLARVGFDWSRTDFFWVDERAVPPSDPESNYGLAQRLWLDPAGVPPGRMHRMPADAADLEAAAGEYDATLARTLGAAPQLDVALLGVGPDGHVASLFPGHAALDDARRVIAVADSPKPPARRLTLGLPLLASAERVVVAAFGVAKAEMLRRALEDPTSALPIARLARTARRIVVLLDPGAASALARSRRG